MATLMRASNPDHKKANVVLHVSSLPFYTVSMQKKAGMPSLTKLVKEFVRRGWKVIFIYPENKHVEAFQEEGIEFYPLYLPRFSKGNSFFGMIVERTWSRITFFVLILSLYLKTSLLIKDFRPTLLYAHGTQAIIASGLLRRNHGVPLVARFYGFTHPGYLLGKNIFPRGSLISKLGDVLALKSETDLIIVTSDGTYGNEVVDRWGVAKKTLVLRNGVDSPERLSISRIFSLKTILGIEQGKPIITFTGRLESWKRPDRIIEVARLANQRGFSYLFVLIGDGDDRLLLEQRVRSYGIEEMVKFIGPVSHEEIWDYLRCSDIFLSLHDLTSLTNTLFEALAIGLPIVCSHNGDGIEELVIDGLSGKLVENPDDANEVITKIQAALEIPHEVVLSAVHLDNWEERFDIEFEKIADVLSKKVDQVGFFNSPQG